MKQWVKLAFFGDSGAWKLVLRPRGAETPRVVAQATKIELRTAILVFVRRDCSGTQEIYAQFSRPGRGLGAYVGIFGPPRGRKIGFQPPETDFGPNWENRTFGRF